MRLNNKGFAISTIMYLILIMAIILITITLTLLSSRKLILDKTREDAKDNIYTDLICEPYDHSDEGYDATGKFLPGEEYICEVKPGVWYNFFVLSSNDKEVNFIMDSNVNRNGEPVKDFDSEDKGTVAWISQETYDNIMGENSIITTFLGPVDALNYLNDATLKWKNLQNIKINYVDEGNSDWKYGKIETIGNTTTITSGSTQLISVTNIPMVSGIYENLKTRMPYYYEVKDYMNEKCWIDSPNYDENEKCWLYTYLEAPEDITKPAVRAYWTFSSDYYKGSRDGAVIVGYDHDVNSRDGLGWIPYDSYYGVRPVISVSIDNIKNN